MRNLRLNLIYLSFFVQYSNLSSLQSTVYCYLHLDILLSYFWYNNNFLDFASVQINRKQDQNEPIGTHIDQDLNSSI